MNTIRYIFVMTGVLETKYINVIEEVKYKNYSRANGCN